MGRYRKRSDRPVVVIPGVGVVREGQVLDGDYDRFVPGLLEDVSDTDVFPIVPEAPALRAVSEPPPAPESEPPPPPEPALESESPAPEFSERDTVPPPFRAEGDFPPYEEWSYADLLTEVGARDLTPGDRKKETLIEALVTDDTEQETPDEVS